MESHVGTFPDCNQGLLDGEEVMPIAVIGVGFRGPGEATDVESFYRLIHEAREARSPVPSSKWNNDAFYHPDANHNGTSNVQAGHYFTGDISRFDAPFFNMTQAEAEALDPQQRLLLECCYEGLENAGIPLDKAAGSKTAVFVGSFCGDYTDILLRDPDDMPLYQATSSGHSRAIISNRLSYFFDFRGPSATIDTACSASLVALHMACQSLRIGESEQAVVAGANVILSHEITISMSRMRFLSPDGRCYAFDERANGYARGEGVGCVILKPLVSALHDGDPIRAVIRNTGVNQDGRTGGITLPNRQAQEELIRRVYEIVSLDPLGTSYVECHGTGTPAGDPLEVGAIANVFCQARSPEQPLTIGSVKTNIGHLEGASGVAGLIKVILMLERKVILPNRNFETPNKRIPFNEWNVKVATTPEYWETDGIRRASVNSFGYGGTNAHAIVDEAEGYLSRRAITAMGRVLNGTAQRTNGFHLNITANRPNYKITIGDGQLNDDHSHPYASNRVTTGSYLNGAPGTQSPSSRIFVLSAADEASCKAYAKRFAGYIEDHENHGCNFEEDLAYTLSERRSRFPWKAAIQARSTHELRKFLKGDGLMFSKGIAVSPLLGFIFTGQGAQWYAMGRELMSDYPAFNAILAKAGAHLNNMGAKWDLKGELERSAEDTRVDQPLYSQSLCTAIQIALTELLASWKIVPTSVTGHSSGEIAAAYAVGALSLEDAMSVAYYRGLLSDKVCNEGKLRGTMMAVGLSKGQTLPYLKTLQMGQVVVACVNSPSSITVSGDVAAIEELQQILDSKKIFARRLVVGVAYHSHHMALVAEEYRRLISHIQVHSSTKQEVQFFSSVSGTYIDPAELGADYWVSNLVGEVKFAQSLHSLCVETAARNKKGRKRSSKSGVHVLVEIGPHSALAAPVQQILKEDQKLERSGIEYCSALIRKRDAVKTCQQLASKLFLCGYQVDLQAVNAIRSNERKPEVIGGLPSYAWNHSRSYWAEPRISKVWRTQQHPRHDLLGLPDRISNPLEPRWRNILRASELPWVKDHQVFSNIVFPAAGYLAMGVEMMRLQAKMRSIQPIGYCLREVTIGKALVFPDTSEEVEVIMSLKPYIESIRSPSDIWNEFSVYSVTEQDRWTEHCRGLVSVREAGTVPNEVTGDSDPEKLAYEERLVEFQNCCPRPIDIDQLYEYLRMLGLDYGPTFANLTEVSAGSNRARSLFRIPNTKAAMPNEFETPFLVHPASFDTIFQSIFPPCEASIGTLKNPLLPVFVEDIFISADITNNPGQELCILTETQRKDLRQSTATITVAESGQSNNCKPVLTITNLTCMSVQNEAGDEDFAKMKRFVYKTHWSPDIDFFTPEDISLLCQDIQPGPSEADTISALEQAGLYYFQTVLEEIKTEEVSNFRPYHQYFWDCIQSFVRASEQDTLHLPTSDWRDIGADARQIFLQKVESSGSEGRLLCHVGKNLSRILRQEVEALQLMVERDLLENYYKDNPRFSRNYQQAERYLEALAHKNPAMVILEVGAGTGGASLPALQALDRASHGAPCCSKYHFTDISSGFFDAAREKLKPWTNLLDFSKLDIEQDPTQQGYEPHSYDLVIAANVLHATRSIQTTMANVRKLLKPSGKLVLIELTRERLTTSTIFGTLPGWWAGAPEGRTQGPTLTEEKWDFVLQQTGFSGLEAAIWDSPTDGFHQGSMMVSTASAFQQDHQKVPSILILTQPSADHVSLETIRMGLSSCAHEVAFSTVESANPRGKICIVLEEISQPFLSQPTPLQFEAVKHIATTAAGILWVTKGANHSVTNPAANFVTGFARTIRSEYGSNRVGVLDLDSINPLSASDTAETIVRVFRKLFLDHQGTAATQDLELYEQGGRILIPRLIEDRQATKSISGYLGGSPLELQPFNSSDRSLVMEVGVPGLLDSIKFVIDSRLQDALPPDEVQVAVHAAGVNFKDVMMAMGQIHYETLGLEFSGTVTAVGSQVQNVVVGDRVCGCCFGAFANMVREKASGVQKLPDYMSFEVAASLPIIFCTAYFSVYKVGRVMQDDTVLIHAASGGLGQALIELCQRTGAEVFTTVSNKEKKDFIMSHFGIPEDHIFFSRDGSFAKNIMRMTCGKGVDVVMNSLAGDMLRLSWECIAPFGRFIELGARDYTVNSRLEMAKFARNVSFSAVNSVSLIRDRPMTAYAVWEEVMDLFRQKSIRPPSPVIPFGISEVEKALRTMQTGKHIGKLVIVPRPEEQVKVAPKSTNALLRPDASYVLVGGLGGLGRAIALWMIDRGARNLIILSRSGRRSPKAQESVALLEEKGATVMVSECDISVASQVVRSLQSAADMPPVRGVIQGAMVLQDRLLENLDISSFNAVTSPKVQGTWNLHDLLPKELDFFLMLSSTSGVIGNASQAPYAASSTFLDAFAQYRRRLGLVASTLDLGVITEIGYVAENAELAQRLERQGFEGTKEKELFALISTAIDRSSESSQLVTGLGTWNENSLLVFQEPRFSHFRQMSRKSMESTADGPNASIRLRDKLRQAKTVPEAIQEVSSAIISKISSLSMIQEQEIQASHPLSDYGIDSLVAVEMRNWIFKEFEAAVTILELLANESLLLFSKKVCTRSRVFDFTTLVA